MIKDLVWQKKKYKVSDVRTMYDAEKIIQESGSR